MPNLIQTLIPPGYVVSEPNSYSVSSIFLSGTPYGFTFFNSSGNQIRPTYISIGFGTTGTLVVGQIIFSGTKEQPNLTGVTVFTPSNITSGALGYIISTQNGANFVFDEDNAPTGFGLYVSAPNNATAARIDIVFGFIKPISRIRSIGHPGIFKNA